MKSRRGRAAQRIFDILHLRYTCVVPRRFIKALGKLFAALSLVMFDAVLACGVRGYFVNDTYFRVGRSRAVALDIFCGEFTLWTAHVRGLPRSCFGRIQCVAADGLFTREVPILNPTGEELWFASFGYTARRMF